MKQRAWAVWYRWALVFPCLGSALLLTLASIIPIRLDYRNFFDLRRTEGMDLRTGVPYLFASTDTESRPYRFANYVLSNLSYPSGGRVWLVPRERTNDARGGEIGVDMEGRLWRLGLDRRETPLGPAIDVLQPFIESGVVLYDTDQARRLFELRLPLLARARYIRVLAPYPSSLFVARRPNNEFTVARFLRFAALFALPCCSFPLIRRWLRSAGFASDSFAASLAVWSSPAVWIWLLSWSQIVPHRAPGAWLFLAWAGAAMTLLYVVYAAPGTLLPERSRTISATTITFRAAMGFLVCLYLAQFVVRLDFDEDTHAHWMVMARSYYVVGSHVPELVRVHAARYPFGFAEILSLAAWAADSKPEDFFRINGSSALALLAYRLGTASLQLAALGLIASYVRFGSPAGRRLWWVGVVLVLVLFPVSQGKHVAAETWLFPLMAGSITALAAGRRLGLPGLFGLGLFVAGAATLVKLEGALLLVTAVLPWSFGMGSRLWSRPKPGLIFGAVLLAAVAPTLLWKLTLNVANSHYRTPSLGNLLASASEISSVFVRSGTVLLKENWTLLLFGALPVAAVSRVARSFFSGPDFGRWREMMVPASVWACCLGFPLIYLFSLLPKPWHIDVSFSRLMMLPVFSSLLYCLESILLHGVPSLNDRAVHP